MKSGLREKGSNKLLKILERDIELVCEAYNSFEDALSRELFIEKIVTLICYEDISLLSNFLVRFSEPVKEFGEKPLFGYPESRYYFWNNGFDFFSSDFPFLVDIGAYDGCSTLSFKNRCQASNINYRVLAIEPDPSNFQALLVNLAQDPLIEPLNIGLWSEGGILRFHSSEKNSLKSSSHIAPDGNIQIEVRCLDSINFNGKITIIKADPPGLDVALEILKGGSLTIQRSCPVLIFPAYHSFEAIYRMPLAIKKLELGYKIYLRHLSWSIGETDVFALPPSYTR
jgi:FkbM family methyltransferase